MQKLPGANCAACPLKDHPCVAPTRPMQAMFALVGEGPGKVEVEEGRAFVGPSGFLVNAGMKAAGLPREEALVTNATACYPAGRKLSPKEWTAAVDACRPRLFRELAEAGDPDVISFGAKALQAMTGLTGDKPFKQPSIMAWFGYPMFDLRLAAGDKYAQARRGETFPLFHPAAALRQGTLIPVFKSLMLRAGRWIHGPWKEFEWPQIEITEGPEAVRILKEIERSGRFGFDVETAGKDPFTSALICIGIGNRDVGAVSVAWPPRTEEVGTRLRKLLAATGTRKAAHNAAHDVLTLEANGVAVAAPIADTMLGHVAAYPQLPHNLGFVTSMFYAMPRWKAAFQDESEMKGDARFVHSDKEKLMLYNARDAIGTDMVDIALQKLVKERSAALTERQG